MRFATSAVWRNQAPPEAAPTTAALEHDAELAWRRTREIALHKIQQLVEFWQIELHELDGPYVPRVQPAALKYQHPLTGDTWDGKGSQPDWLRQALLKDGYLLDEVKPGTPAFERAKHRGQA